MRGEKEQERIDAKESPSSLFHIRLEIPTGSNYSGPAVYLPMP